MSGARLQPIEDPDAETAEFLAAVRKRGGLALNLFETLAHDPELLKRLDGLARLFLAEGLLARRDVEIVVLRTAWRTGSEYEFGVHTLLSRKHGLGEAEIAGLGGGDYDWPERDRLLIDVADQIQAQACLNDATWESLHANFGSAAALELIMLPGYYRMLAGMLKTIRVEREPGVPGWPDLTTQDK